MDYKHRTSIKSHAIFLSSCSFTFLFILSFTLMDETDLVLHVWVLHFWKLRKCLKLEKQI